MQRKKHSTPKEPASGRSSSPGHQQGCPLLQVVGLNEYGVVLESQRSFDVGSALTIGFHVESPLRKNSDKRRTSSFISAEAIVVESQYGTGRDGSSVFRVTLMFSDISSEDRSWLMRASAKGFQTARSRMSGPRFGLN